MTISNYFTWFPRLCGLDRASKPQGKADGAESDSTKTRSANGSLSSSAEKTQNLRTIAEEIARDFDFSNEDLQEAVTGFVQQLNQGLRASGCDIEQLPSFLDRLPSGQEQGTCLAVDLGGTNVRICSITFIGDRTYSLVQDKTAIPAPLMTSENPEELFDWVAKIVQGFLESHRIRQNEGFQVEGSIINLGFTFSHAVQQIDINQGTLIRWSKGFDIDGTIGQDVCMLLQNALTRLSLPIRVTALINDTVGTLLTSAYTSSQSGTNVLGAVFGTGTNGAYVEQANRITKIAGRKTEEHNIMVMNTEWGNFDQGLNFLPDTAYDRLLDIASVNPGFEMFEKRISGMYLGELLRLAILALHRRQKLDFLADQEMPAASVLQVPYSLDSSVLSMLEADSEETLLQSRIHLQECLRVRKVSFETAEAIRTIAKAIGRRAARLSAVAIGSVIVQTNSLEAGAAGGGHVRIGVDGSLVELYPQFLSEIKHSLRSIEAIGSSGEAKLEIAIIKDGSAVGAALAALVAPSSGR